MDEKFRERLKDELERLSGDMSQRAFADALGISQSTISDYLLMKRNPDIGVIIKIAEYGGKLPEQLLAELYGRVYGEDLPTIEAQVKPQPVRRKVELLRWLSAEVDRDLFG
jgi:transcriptional regulator with XRE-family HTH domain